MWSEQAKGLTQPGFKSVAKWEVLGQTNLSLPCLVANQPLHTPGKWSLGFSSPSLCLSGSLSTKVGGRGCLFHVGPQDWDAPSMAWTAHSPGWASTYANSLFLLVSSQGHRSQPNIFPSPTWLCENCSRSPGCIGDFLSVNFLFHVYMYFWCVWWEVSATILPLCHLDPPSSVFFSLVLQNRS